MASSLLVWQASHAAFSGATDNGPSSWASGTVALGDDDSGTALFSATSLKPGDSGTRCILVTYNGTLAASVKLSASATGGLAPFLNLTVEEGTGGTNASCAGFTSSATLHSGTLSGFAAAASGYATGVGSFAPTAAGQSRSYRFTYTVQDNNSAQGTSATATFTWEARSG